jgi:diacylglycerol kinase family enzyme
MAPQGSIDDGLLDVVVMSKITRWNLLRLFPAIFTGKHVEDPSVEVFKGREIEIKTAKPLLLTPDGETFGTTPLSVKVLNRKIRIFC